MTVTDTQLLAWLQAFLFPFIRIGGVFMVAPLIGSRIVPARVRLLLAALLTLVLSPLLPPAPAMEMFSAAWCVTLVQQMAIGIAMGFVLQIVFEAAMVAGELIANSMGLGFAQLADPLRGAPSPVVGQFVLTLASLTFLALGGHLMLLELVARSFQSLPVGPRGVDGGQWQALARLGSQLFAGGVALALPVMIGLLVINLAIGVLGRAAPALNLIAVGFPVALIAGLILWVLDLPALQDGIVRLLQWAWPLIAALGGKGGAGG